MATVMTQLPQGLLCIHVCQDAARMDAATRQLASCRAKMQQMAARAATGLPVKPVTGQAAAYERCILHAKQLASGGTPVQGGDEEV